MNKRTWMAGLLLLAALVGVRAQEDAVQPAARPTAATVIDFYDTLPRLGNRVWTRADAEQWMQTFADTGFDVLYLRMSNGRAYWPSRVLSVYTDDGHVAWGANLEESVKDRDLLKEFVDLAHKHGKKAVYWLPIYDDETTIINYANDPDKAKKYGFYPLQSRLGRDQPQLQWEHRDAWKQPGTSDLLRPGVRRWWGGCPVYLYPEARQYRLDLCREIVEKYDMDGIAYSLRTHSMSPGWPDALKDYGFNQIIVDAYKNRYGVDIRTQRFDRVKWQMLRGEGLTALIRETYEYLDSRNKEFHMMVTPGPFAGFGDYSYLQEQKHLLWGGVHCDFEKWVTLGWVHTVILYGTMPRDEFTPAWQAEAAQWQRLLAPREIPLFFFYRLLGSDAASTQHARYELDRMANDPNIDGLIMYEADNFWPFPGRENPLHKLLQEYFAGTPAALRRESTATATAMPLELYGQPVGSEASLVVTLDTDPAGAVMALLDLTMADVDEQKEVQILVNGHGPLAPPRLILSGEDPRRAALSINSGHLHAGENTITFRFADNLNGTTGGFDVHAAAIVLVFKE